MAKNRSSRFGSIEPVPFGLGDDDDDVIVGQETETQTPQTPFRSAGTPSGPTTRSVAAGTGRIGRARIGTPRSCVFPSWFPKRPPARDFVSRAKDIRNLKETEWERKIRILMSMR